VVAIDGLNLETPAAVQVSGPGGYTRSLSHSATLTGLETGNYIITAAPVSRDGTRFLPTPDGQTGVVSAGGTATAGVSYSAASAATAGGFNLRIDGLYLTQAVQRYDGSVPLVAGRSAYLRVFGVASNRAGVRPTVRVRLYVGSVPTLSFTLRSKEGPAPTEVNQGSLTSSWNVMVPGIHVVPGLRVLAEIDPDRTIEESSESDNTFPADGQPRAVEVHQLPLFKVRLVPVLQQVNGLQGNVTPALADRFLSDARILLPIAELNVDVRAPYSTSAPALQSDNANDAWGTVLSELRALKAADRDARYYYGVAKTSYSSGVGGIGYVGGNARTGLGWDRLPSGSYVMAHEVAHNMGRSHAPCGVSGADPAYPHAGGKIGAWGFDPVWITLKDPGRWVDLTGYCNPYWVSAYSWEGMMSYRQGGPSSSPREAEGRVGGAGLLVWGRITAKGPVLEPAFSVDEGAGMPAPGPHRIEALAEDGSLLFSVPFGAGEVADLPTGPEEAFAFVLPRGQSVERIAQLRLVAGGRVALQRSRAGPVPAPSLSRDDSGVLQWDAARYPMVLVRDRITGEVLSFARGGKLRLPPTGHDLELTFSDGVSSRRIKY